MRIIKPSTVRACWRERPDAEAALRHWMDVVEAARWRSIAEVRKAFPHADAVTVGSDRTATVFNIAGNRYRLITAIHYNSQLGFVLRFLTHAEYDKDAWKRQL